MPKQVFPVDFIQFSVDNIFQKHNLKSQIIYLIILLSISIFMLLLPFIYVDVNIKSRGIIRPAAEKTNIVSLINGHVVNSNLRENMSVLKGDTLVILKDDELEEDLKHNKERQNEINQYINDLEILTKQADTSPPLVLESHLYRKQYEQFRIKYLELKNKYDIIKKQYNRNIILFDEKVIAPLEFENYTVEKEKTEAELDYLLSSHISDWQSQLNQYSTELLNLIHEVNQLDKLKENYYILSPISGTIQNFVNIYNGSYIFANQNIAEISPDSLLVVECYISPKDIGFIKQNQPARFQIDAFNYNEWGIATGTIQDISEDVLISNDQPVFKIKCSLDNNFLLLKNNYRGYFKKGMTLQANFLVTRRSVFKLLYDKVDDWLNPNTY